MVRVIIGFAIWPDLTSTQLKPILWYITMYLVMEFAVDCLYILADHLESVRTIAVHMAVAIWNTTITEQKGNLMSSLRTKTDKIPEHINILHTL